MKTCQVEKVIETSLIKEVEVPRKQQVDYKKKLIKVASNITS